MEAHFNPRSHEGSDSSGNYKHAWKRISIHAPTKGATSDVDELVKKITISIHAPTKGATGKS